MLNEIVDLTQISSVSNKWNLKLLSRVGASEDGQNLGHLLPKQQASLAFHVDQIDAGDQTTHTDLSLLSTEALSCSASTPTRPLLHRCSQPLTLSDMHAVLGWKATGVDTSDPSSARSGQHYVSNCVFELPVEVGEMFHSSPVKVCVDFKSINAHDFTSCCMCNIPVTISIQNCCERSALELTWEGFAPDERDALTDANGKYAAPYVWAGVTRKHFNEKLYPGEQVQVKTSISVWQAGLYNVNRFRVRVGTPSGILPLVYIPPVQHVLTVTNSAAPASAVSF